MKPLLSAESIPAPESVTAVTSMAFHASVPVRRTRYKLWEIQSCWHCMVIGTGLKLADVRQAAAKVTIPVKNKSDYDLHQLAVECAADKNHPLTQQLHKRLDRLYATDIKLFRTAKTPDALKALWVSGWKSGRVGGSLWALITSQLATREVIQHVFGEVHMMSHLSGASVCVDKKRLLAQEREIGALTSALDTAKQRCTESSKALADHKRLLENERASVRLLKARMIQMQAAAPKPRIVRATSTYPDALVQRLRTQITDSQRKLSDLQTANHQQAEQIERLRRLIKSNSGQPSQVADDALRLCGQCVLYLGGKAQQRRHFQALVESCDGRFLHHDGGRESCPHRIAELVNQADVVMCLTDCISHRAMEKARTLCAKQDKPIVFMKRASLSNFTRSLHETLG